MKKYYNKKHKAKKYEVGDKVLLSTRNIRTRYTSPKLLDKFLGPFSIVEYISMSTYYLNLLVKYE